jgi:hypothetical protein
MKMFDKIKTVLTHLDWSRFAKYLENVHTFCGLAAFMCVASWALDRELPVRNLGPLKVLEREGDLYPAEISYDLVRQPIDCNVALDFSRFDKTGRLLPGGVHSFHTASAFSQSVVDSPGVFKFYLDGPAITPGDTIAGAVRYSCGNNVLQYIMPLTLEYKSALKVVP